MIVHGLFSSSIVEFRFIFCFVKAACNDFQDIIPLLFERNHSLLNSSFSSDNTVFRSRQVRGFFVVLCLVYRGRLLLAQSGSHFRKRLKKKDMSMSGSAKRVHEEFSRNLSAGNGTPSAKQHEAQHGATTTNGDTTSGDMGPYVDSVTESRPPKFPRFDYGSRFQKRLGVDDPVVNYPSFRLDDKGDSQDTKSKASTDEKGCHADSRVNNHEEKGEADASRHMSLNSVHDTQIVTTERFNRSGGGSSSSSWRMEQQLEHREDSGEVWKDRTDEKWNSKADTHEEKGEKDTQKDDRFDLMHDTRNLVTERGNGSIIWRRDQGFEHGEDTREPWKDYKEHRVSVRQVADHREDKEKGEKLAWWGGHSNNVMEPGRERWDKEKEKKERGRDKERDNKRDHNSRDNGEKEGLGMVKQVEDFLVSKKAGSEGGNQEENLEVERKSSKDLEDSKTIEIEERERKKERDHEKKMEHERLVERKSTEKEPEDIDPEDSERDKETFVNYNFQQRKRMLRPRGHSQAVSRDGHSRFLAKDLDGNQGSSETTAILYRPGEYMPELTKLWKEYESSLAPKSGEDASMGQGPTIEIWIPSKLVTTSNHQVRSSQLWGTDVYTDDSDLVAVLMHTGYYRPTASSPPTSVKELHATIRVLPPQDSYTSTLRNNIRSRAWGAASGCSYSVDKCCIVKVSGGQIELEPCLTRISAVAPTLAPAAMERTMTTRSASSNAYRQQRFVQEVTIQYSLCNEPWMKYSMNIVADRGLKKSQYTSARLRKGEVLYLETHRKRYELSYDGEKVACNGGFGATTATSAPVIAARDKSRDKENEKTLCNHNGEKTQGRGTSNNDKGILQTQNRDAFDHYKWACCRQPLPLKVMLAKGVPLLNELTEVLEDGLAWEEIQWSQAGVWVRGKEYPLARAQFLSQNLENLE